MGNKILAVPQKEIESIEEARLELYDLLESQCKDLNFLIALGKITEKMYRVAHRNYPEVPYQSDLIHSYPSIYQPIEG